jgi:hypothetical protein
MSACDIHAADNGLRPPPGHAPGFSFIEKLNHAVSPNDTENWWVNKNHAPKEAYSLMCGGGGVCHPPYLCRLTLPLKPQYSLALQKYLESFRLIEYHLIAI